MNFWIYRDNRQQGPFSIEQLQTLNLTPETPVWYEGLAKWIPAGEAPLTASLFRNQPADADQAFDSFTEVIVEEVGPDSDSEATGTEVSAAGSERAAQSHESPSWRPAAPVSQAPKGKQANDGCPPTNLFWAIISTLCCCTPLGIVAIIFSSQVRTKFQRGDVAGATKASDISAWLIMISIAFGLMFMPLSLAIYG